MTEPGERVRRRQLLRVGLVALGAMSAGPGLVLAQPAGSPGRREASAGGPQGPVRILVAYPPGGVSDSIARALAVLLAQRLSRPVRVEHRPGGGGSLALEQMLREPADGRTLCFCASSALTLLPWVRRVGYDPLRDVAPVIPVMATPVLVLGTPALHAETLREAMGLARASPGRLRWATSGIGTTGHLVLEQVGHSAAVELTHVPYKGGGQQLNDALAGHFELLSSNVAEGQLAHVQAGRLRALAVGAPTRLPVLPEVPTLAEAGFPQANLMSVFGLFASARTPPRLVERLNRELDAVLQDEGLRRRMQAMDNLPLGGSGADFARRIAQEREAHRERLQRQDARESAQPPGG